MRSIRGSNKFYGEETAAIWEGGRTAAISGKRTFGRKAETSCATDRGNAWSRNCIFRAPPIWLFLSAWELKLLTVVLQNCASCFWSFFIVNALYFRLCFSQKCVQVKTLKTVPNSSKQHLPGFEIDKTFILITFFL